MMAGRLQMTGKPVWALSIFAVALALSSCAATGPAKPSSTSPATTGASVGNYRRVVRNGQTLYCINEIPTGKRMVEETCVTQAQMNEQEEKARNFTQGTQGMALPLASPNSH
ncbi:MAG TPA: hypothetical protein VGV09_01095 [Steroidobacteraceae bacterium]|nr:hypothetical protein [Steroidobacteraceae bacterium]